jgi:CBS domain containing-hemolysin-like protein
MLIAIAGILLFSGLETAFLMVDNLRIELDRKHKVLGSEIIRLFTNHSSLFILGMHMWKIISAAVFITVFHISYGPIFSHTFSQATGILFEIVICAIILFIIAEYLSKSLFMPASYLLLRLFSVPAFIFFLVSYPFGTFFIFISESLFGVKESEKERIDSEDSVFTGTDLLKPGK